MPIYMRVSISTDSTIDGDSTSAQYRNWFNVMSFSWGEANASSRGGTGRTTALPFTIMKPSGKGSPALMLACAEGRHFSEVIVAVTLPGTGHQESEIQRFVLSPAELSTYDIGGDGGSVPVEKLELIFDSMHFTQQTSTGQQEATVDFSGGGA